MKEMTEDKFRDSFSRDNEGVDKGDEMTGYIEELFQFQQ